MTSYTHKTWIEIDAVSLASNLAVLKHAAHGTHLAPALKANAYGHGLKEVLSLIKNDPDITHIGLDNVLEAAEARNYGYTGGIILLGYTPHTHLEDVLDLDCDQVVYDEETVHVLDTIAARKNIHARVHIKIETGTMRQGADMANLDTFLQHLKDCTHLQVVGASTHFASSEEPADPMTSEQHARFEHALSRIRASNYFPTLIHSACSAAIITRPDTHHTLVRPGIALYGLYPSKTLRSTMLQDNPPGMLTPVLRWKTIIAQIKSLPAGTPIGYSHTETTARQTRLAVIPIGYADGLDRGLSSRGSFLIRGKRAKIMGRICMNMCMVDVTDIPDAKPEDEVVVIGTQGNNQITADEIADELQTIHYEIIARLNPKIPRLII